MGRQLLEMIQFEAEAGEFVQVEHLPLLYQLFVDLLLHNTKKTINNCLHCIFFNMLYFFKYCVFLNVNCMSLNL